jgi:Arc/MetJ-type ribon-helix-helix transcriptional regulator
MEITLTPELERFIADEIADGAFPSGQALVLALLSLYREKKLAVMRREVMIGVEQADRGEVYEMTDEFIAELKAEIERDLAEEGLGDEKAAGQPPSASRLEDNGKGNSSQEQVSVGSSRR